MCIVAASVLLIVSLCSSQEPVNKHSPSNLKTQRPTTETKDKPPSTVLADSPTYDTATTAKSENSQAPASNRVSRIEIAPQSDRWFKVYVISSIAIAAINFGVLFVIWRQRKEMQGQRGIMAGQLTVMEHQLQEMKIAREETAVQAEEAGEKTEQLIQHASDQADALLTAGEIALTNARATVNVAEATQRVAEASKAAADAAKASAETAVKSAQAIINAQRPWIFIEIKASAIAWAAGSPPESIAFSVKFRNRGSTPAEIVGFDQHIQCRNSSDDLPTTPTYSLEGEVFAHTRMIPTGEAFEPPGEPSFVPTSFFPPDQWKEIRSSRKRLIYWGRIQYRDLIEDAKTIHEVGRAATIHETCFCYFWSPALNEFLICGPLGYNKHT